MGGQQSRVIFNAVTATLKMSLVALRGILLWICQRIAFFGTGARFRNAVRVPLNFLPGSPGSFIPARFPWSLQIPAKKNKILVQRHLAFGMMMQ